MPNSSASTARSALPLIVLCCAFIALVWPPILFGRQAISEANDQNDYHLPVIQTMAQQWPSVDLAQYQSATSPGYHLLMAVVHRSITDNVTALRLISSLFGLGLVVCVFYFARLRINGWLALAYTSPLLCSSYILSGAMWLTTDDAAWMFAAMALGIAAMRTPTPVRTVSGAIVTALAIFVRQIHIWLIAPLGMAALLRLRSEKSARPAMVASMFSLILPLAVLMWLIAMWGGLVPPGNEEVARLHSRGMNPAALPLTLALFGVFGIFFCVPCTVRTIRVHFVNWRTFFVVLAALICTLIVPTAYSPVQETGRWGGAIWLAIKAAPSFGDRSFLVTCLAIIGAVMLLHGWRQAAMAKNSAFASLLLFGVLCWLAAQSMNTQVWQRYLEPMVLIALPWLASLGWPRNESERDRLWRHAIGPLALALLQLALASRTVYRPIITGEIPT